MANVQKTNQAITNKLTKIENALRIKLNTFYKKNIKGRPEPIEVLRKVYEREIKNIIRQTAQESYLYGTDIVATTIREKNKDFVSFISTKDIQNISTLAEKQNDQFWKTSGRLHNREAEFVLSEDKEMLLKNQFDNEAAMMGFGAFVAYDSYNNAVLNKVQELAIEIVAFTQLLFVTRNDPNVDPIMCRPLHNKRYDLLDSFIPVPPLHKHCRCKLIPVFRSL